MLDKVGETEETVMNTAANGETPVVLVGVDGSTESEQAIDWAAAYTQAFGGDLHVVTTWAYPMSYGLPIATTDFDPEADARAILDKAVARVDLPAERVRAELVHGAAPIVLTERSKSADVLVLGARGHGGFVGLVLGSTSQYCTHHSACTIVIVR
jgi:nucleotide-binding universal stress UspA family protein